MTFTGSDLGWAVVEAGVKMDGEDTARSIAFTIMVKYVRREIRRLTTEDRYAPQHVLVSQLPIKHGA